MRAVDRSLVCIVLAIFFSAGAYAYEVDNFTDRDKNVRDALPVLDHEVNSYLSRAVTEANLESPRHCNRIILRREILRWSRPDPVGMMELWVAFSKEIDQVSVSMSNSIYAGVSFMESPVMWVAGVCPSISVGGHWVGADKLGHFFNQGLDYFKKVQDGADLHQVLLTGHGEDGIFGLPATGVRSYADMAANYGGYKFWSQLYQGPNPYVRCDKDGKWIKVRDFTFADYVNDAWDEAINCSEFLPSLQPKVTENLEKRGLKCPIQPDVCADIARLEYAEYYVSPACRGAVGGRKRAP